MNNKRCPSKACSCLGIVVSIIFGAIIGILFANNFIPGIVIATWIAFGIGILSLIFLFTAVIVSATHQSTSLNKCLKNNTTCLLVGIFGTIISALAALSIVLVPTFISIIVLVAIGAFFFALMIIGIIILLSCIVCETDNHHHV